MEEKPNICDWCNGVGLLGNTLDTITCPHCAESTPQRKSENEVQFPFFVSPDGKHYYCYKDVQGRNQHSNTFDTHDEAVEDYSKLFMFNPERVEKDIDNISVLAGDLMLKTPVIRVADSLKLFAQWQSQQHPPITGKDDFGEVADKQANSQGYSNQTHIEIYSEAFIDGCIYASQPFNPWVKTSECKPNNSDWILAYYEHGEYMIHSYDTIRKLNFVKWMPLPRVSKD